METLPTPTGMVRFDESAGSGSSQQKRTWRFFLGLALVWLLSIASVFGAVLLALDVAHRHMAHHEGSHGLAQAYGHVHDDAARMPRPPSFRGPLEVITSESSGPGIPHFRPQQQTAWPAAVLSVAPLTAFQRLSALLLPMPHLLGQRPADAAKAQQCMAALVGGDNSTAAALCPPGGPVLATLEILGAARDASANATVLYLALPGHALTVGKTAAVLTGTWEDAERRTTGSYSYVVARWPDEHAGFAKYMQDAYVAAAQSQAAAQQAANEGLLFPPPAAATVGINNSGRMRGSASKTTGSTGSSRRLSNDLLQRLAAGSVIPTIFGSPAYGAAAPGLASGPADGMHVDVGALGAMPAGYGVGGSY